MAYGSSGWLVLVFVAGWIWGGGSRVYGQSDYNDLTLLQKQEVALDGIVNEVRALFEDRCRHVQKCKCSHQACSSEEPDLYECNPTFSAPDFCSNCTTPRERKLSFKESVIQTTEDTTSVRLLIGNNTERASLSKGDQKFQNEDICYSRILDYIFRKNAVDDIVPESLQHFFSKSSRLWRSFPGMLLYDRETGQCKDNLAIEQNMFTSAITGPLNIVITCDHSLYTNERIEGGALKMTNSQFVARDFIHALSSRDRVNFIHYNHVTRVLFENQGLVPVTEETKNTLEEFVMAGYPSGGANLTAGVLEAMNRFQMNALEMNSQRNGANTPCNNVLVVISSGEDDCFSRCLVSEEVCTCSGDLIDKVNKKNDEIAILTGGRRVMILPVVLSEYDKIPVLRQLACATGGMSERFSASKDHETVFEDYLAFVGAGLAPPGGSGVGELAWTEPMILSGFGLEPVGSVSQSVYHDFGDGELNLFGVAAVSFKKTKLEEEKALEALYERIDSYSCRLLEYTDCALSRLRETLGISRCARQQSFENVCYTKGNKVYALIPVADAKPFSVAENRCKNMRGSLVKIGENDEDLNEHLAAIAGYNGAWIGLRSLSGEPESYRFVVDNSTVPEIAKSKYWSETEPRKPPPDEKLALCVAIDNRGSVKNWETYPCHLSKQYICEFEESAVLTSARSSCTVTGYSEDGNENNSRSVKPFPTSSDPCNGKERNPRETCSFETETVKCDLRSETTLTPCQKTCCVCNCTPPEGFAPGAIAAIVIGTVFGIVILALVSLGVYLFVIAPRRKKFAEDL